MIKQRFLSLGAGVQSSTLALMIEKGLIEGVSCAIFADTQGASAETMEWLEWLKSKLSYPVYRVSAGSLEWHTIWKLNNIIDDPLSIPFFIKKTGKFANDKRKIGMLPRQCSYKYKLIPIKQKIRQVLGIKKSKKMNKRIIGDYVEVLLGLSYDELLRVKKVNRKSSYTRQIFPLVDLKMTRQDCINWMKKNYSKTPPRSSCVFCPYHSDEGWRKLRNNPKEWKRLVEFDKKLRDPKDRGHGKFKFPFKDNLYLHKSCKPLEEIDFKEKNEPSKLVDACEEGYCGV